MFFSVIVPLYNKRKYIRRCVDSVLGQSFTDFELIVVDDGSTDGSHEEIAVIDDERLRVILQENQGASNARNKGMSSAKGEWIALLDADDAWFYDHLEEISKIAKEYPEAGLISTKGKETTQRTINNIERESFDYSRRRIDYFLEASKNIGVINSSTAVIRRDVYESIGGFLHHKAGEDLEYWARVALNYPVAVSDHVTSLYYRDTGGIMQQIHSEHSHKVNSISSVRDFSASLATICEEAEKNPDIWKNYSIKTYLNSRIQNAIKGALYRNAPNTAKHYAGFMIKTLNYRFILYYLIKGVPAIVLKWAVYFYKKI
jgi:glycosyltransferase involved in cell wall biosynthesis